MSDLEETAVVVADAMPAWELRLLASRVRAQHLDLRPPRVTGRKVEHLGGGARAITIAATAEDAWAWWVDRRRRARHYLRRAVSGHVPADEFERRTMSPSEQADLARVAILVAARAMHEAPKKARAIERRLRVLTSSAVGTPALRSLAARVADRDIMLRGGKLELAAIEDSGVEWIGLGLERARLRASGLSYAPTPLESATADLFAEGFSRFEYGREGRHMRLRRVTREHDFAYVRAELRELAMHDIGEAGLYGDRALLQAAVVALVHVDALARLQRTWTALDPSHLESISTMSDAPPEVAELAREFHRFPESIGDTRWTRPMWGAIDSARARSDARGAKAAAAGETTTPADDGVVLEVSPRGRRILIGGKPALYGKPGRGGEMTLRHRGARLLVALASGGAAPVDANAQAVSDANEALARAGALHVCIRVERGVPRLEGHLVCTEALRGTRHKKKGG